MRFGRSPLRRPAKSTTSIGVFGRGRLSSRSRRSAAASRLASSDQSSRAAASRTAAMGRGWMVSPARSSTSTLRCEYLPASSSPPGEASGSASATRRA